MKCIHFEKRDVSVGNDAFDHPTYHCYCHKKNCQVQEYKCSICELREFAPAAMVPVGRCDKCPYVKMERTPNAGYAFDYFCKACGDRKIVGYVEYDSEIPPVPGWCPYHIKEEK